MSSGNSTRSTHGNYPGLDLFPPLQNSADDDATPNRRQPHSCFEGNQNQKIGCNPCSSEPVETNTYLQPERQPPIPSYGVNSVACDNSVSSGTAISSKLRIRWTLDLHNQYVECVNCLGGAGRATSKDILKLMDSHLQKSCIAPYTSQSTEDKATQIAEALQLQLDVQKRLSEQLEKCHLAEYTPESTGDRGTQIAEALKLQLDVERHLHEQLEKQRTLQLQIEEQGRQLKMMLDQQRKTNVTLTETHKLDIMFVDNPSNDLKDIQVLDVEGIEESSLPRFQIN